MTDALVVVAVDHDPERHRELAERARRGLRAAGYRVDLVDLAGFELALTRTEREAYHGPQPILDPAVRESAEIVSRATVVVFVYPTRTGALPARLKGWLDRVLVPGVAFGFDAAGKVRPGLTNVSWLVGVATYDESALTMSLRGDVGRRTMLRALRMSCGWRTRTRWFAQHGRTTARDRAEFGARVERELAELS